MKIPTRLPVRYTLWLDDCLLAIGLVFAAIGIAIATLVWMAFVSALRAVPILILILIVWFLFFRH